MTILDTTIFPSEVRSVNGQKGIVVFDSLTLAAATTQANLLLSRSATERARYKLCEPASDLTTLEAGAVYSLNTPAGSAYSRPLPASAVVGDSVVFANAWRNWHNATFTVTMPSEAHLVNGVAEPVLINNNDFSTLVFTYLHYTGTQHLWCLSAS